LKVSIKKSKCGMFIHGDRDRKREPSALKAQGHMISVSIPINEMSTEAMQSPQKEYLNNGRKSKTS